MLKIYLDRPVSQTVSFAELQQLGLDSHQTPVGADSLKDREWIERLDKANPKSGYIIDRSQSTAPGRSPGSSTTASTTVTPNIRTKIRSQVLVRADTSKLSSTELSEWDRTESSRMFYSHSPGQRQVSGSKRKLPSADVTPEANLPNKRVKVLEVPGTAPRPRQAESVPDPDSRQVVSSPCEGVTGRGDRAVSKGLNTTPPWCKWSGQSELSPTTPQSRADSSGPQGSVARSPTREGVRTEPQAVPSFREPLSDITNASLEQTRRGITSATEPSTDRSRERGSHKPGSASTLTKRLQEETSKKPQAQGLDTGIAVLPTPPTSSPAHAEVKAPKAKAKHANTVCSSCDPQERGLTLPGQRKCLDRVVSGTATSHRPTLSHSLPSTLRPTSAPKDSPLYASPILLSESMSHLHTHPSRPLETLLRRIPTAFTYSTICLLDSLEAGDEKPPIILVDIARPDAVAQAMKAISKHLQNKVSDGTLHTRGRALFLEWNWLRALATLPTGVGDMKRHFGGCLAWDSKQVSGAGGSETVLKRSIKAIFNWEEALALA